MTVKIGDTIYEAYAVDRLAGDMVQLTLAREGLTLAGLAALFDADTPRIAVLGEDGTTQALYQGHALTALTLDTCEDGACVGVTVQVKPLVQDEAERLGERIDTLTGRLSAQEDAGGAVRRMAQARAESEGVTANEMIAMAALLRAWEPGTYAVGDVRAYEGEPYRCVQAHDSTDNPAWAPPAVPALWAAYHATAKDYALPWHMPTGAQDAYNTGEWMRYTDGIAYRCERDGVVWGPDMIPEAWKAEE